MKYALEARDIARNIEKCLNGGPVDLAAMRVQADRLAQHAHLVRSVEGISRPKATPIAEACSPAWPR